MCRLLGMYGQMDGWQNVALEFSKLAEYGMVPPVVTEPGHKDGWGMAGSNDEQTCMVEVTRQLGSAHGSSEYQDTIHGFSSQPHILLGHIRKASPGIPVSIGNVHPFMRKQWAFIHNGTLYDPETLPIDPAFELVSDGSDSEYLFGFLLNILSKAKDDESNLKVIAKALSSLNTNHSSINCILSNGSELIAVRDYQRFGDYLSLYYYPMPEGVVICSEPLETPQLDQNEWIPFPNHSILEVTGSPPQIELSTYSG